MTRFTPLRAGASRPPHTAGVQPVNTRLSGFVCLAKRGALAPDFCSLCFPRSPAVCHLMRIPWQGWRRRGSAVPPVWVKRATAPSNRGSLGASGALPEHSLLDLAPDLVPFWLVSGIAPPFPKPPRAVPPVGSLPHSPDAPRKQKQHCGMLEANTASGDSSKSPSRSLTFSLERETWSSPHFSL